mmetsp:Transcript_87171/g.154358  ORF Transcript_87171/g.154358 Transcript_87171/m.154358 type:complete len:532 (-) Transcript_87171:127-1722(-)
MAADEASVVAAMPFVRRLKSAGKMETILKIINEAELLLDKDGHALSDIYKVAVESYKCPAAAQDPDFRELCVKHMCLLCKLKPEEAREFHNRQRAFSLHHGDARMYEARAAMEERQGDSAKAVKMINEGLRLGAQPAELLQQYLLDFKKRTENPTDEGDTSEPDDMDIVMSASQEMHAASPAKLTKERSKPDLDSAQDQLLQQAQVQQLQQQLQLQELLRTRYAMQRLLGSVERRNMLAETFSAWKRASEQAACHRREALFDSMRGQMQAAKNRYQAAEKSHISFLKLVELNAGRVLAKASMRAWRSVVKLIGRRLRSAGAVAQVASSSRARVHLMKVFMSWRRHAYHCALERSNTACPEPVLDADPGSPSLDRLLQEMSVNKQSSSSSPLHEARDGRSRCKLTRSSSAGPTRPESPQDPGQGRQSPLRRPPSPLKGVRRQPLAEQDDNIDSTFQESDCLAAGAYKRLRGPERFYYDTSSYTGCARFGGPSVGKENEMELRSNKAKQSACTEKTPVAQQPLQAKRPNVMPR